MEEIIISEIPFKTPLSFFGKQEEIIIRELGDTWHPADGFVDEQHFRNPKTVEEFLNVNYDFRGLIIFYGQIGQCTIVYDRQNYRVRAPKKEIEKLKQKLRNAEQGYQK